MRRQVRKEQAVEARRAGEHGAAHHDGRRAAAQHVLERLARGEASHPCELRRLFERTPQDEAQGASEATDDEREAPSEDGHVFGWEQRPKQQADTGGRGHAEGHAGEYQAAHERRLSRRGLDDVGERTRQLATEAEALHQAQQHHQRAGRNAPLGMRRNESHTQRSARHHEQRPQEHTPPTMTIPVVTEDDTAEGADQVAGGKGRERRHQRDEQRAARKNRIGDVPGENAEHDEVVEFERAAEAGEQDDAPAGGCHAAGGAGRRTTRDSFRQASCLHCF